MSSRWDPKRHGPNAVISEDGLTATRQNHVGHWKGSIVMIEGALSPDQRYFEVELIEQGKNAWSGVLMLAFSHSPFGSLQECDNSSPDYTLSEFTEPIDNSAVSLTNGDIVGLLLETNGKTRYYVNGKPFGYVARTIFKQYDPKRPLYALVDLYGRTSAIKLVTMSGSNLLWGPHTHKK